MKSILDFDRSMLYNMGRSKTEVLEEGGAGRWQFTFPPFFVIIMLGTKCLLPPTLYFMQGTFPIGDISQENVPKEFFMEMDFDVRITAASMFDYLMRHTYTGIQGIVGLCIGAAVLGYFFYTGVWSYLIIALVILLYLPLTLFMKAVGQINSNPAFKEPIHYHADEQCLAVSQKGTTQTLRWALVEKAVATNMSIIIYTSPVNAWIFPKKDLGDRLEDFIRLIKACLPPEKVRFRT